MSRDLRIAALQVPPIPIGADRAVFATDVRRVVDGHPDVQMIVYPELHLFGDDGSENGRSEVLRSSAVPLDGGLVADLAAVARSAGVWLLPGTVCEKGPGGELFNTAVVFSPDGDLVASYRKIFPWRPYEPYDPGDRFVVVDLDGFGRIGLSICYDAWFPEVTRHLAWLGAEVVVNVVKTTTADRAQEIVLARANSIVNQVFTVSVNCAGPVGTGHSLIVDPEGDVRVMADGVEPTVLLDTIDLDRVAGVRELGTAGLNRMWSQFLPSDRPLDLPLYQGRIEPDRWHPRTHPQHEQEPSR